jgi:Na+/H+ antiporter NhaD/arsenite permease-like protein
MFAWLGEHQEWMWTLLVLSVVTLLASIVVLPFYVAGLPADYFVHTKRQRRARRGSGWSLMRIARTVFGAILVVAGLLMLVLPGQGVLTLLVGLTLVEFPGKFRLERALVRRGPVLNGLNWLRRRRGAPPLLAPDGPEAE